MNVLVGALISAGAIISAIILGTSLIIFFDVYTVLLAILLPAGFLIQAHGFKSLKILAQAMGRWVRSERHPPEQLSDARSVVASASKANILSAHICVLIGVVQIAQGIAPDDIGVIGPAVSVALLSYFYALCIEMTILGPVGRRLDQQAA